MVPVTARMATRPRYIRLSLDSKDPEIARVLDFADTAFPGQPVTNAMRELLVVGLGSDPLSPAIMAARQSAYATASYTVRMRLAAALRDIANDLELESVMARARIVDEQTKPCEVCGHAKYRSGA